MMVLMLSGEYHEIRLRGWRRVAFRIVRRAPVMNVLGWFDCSVPGLEGGSGRSWILGAGARASRSYVPIRCGAGTGVAPAHHFGPHPVGDDACNGGLLGHVALATVDGMGRPRP